MIDGGLGGAAAAQQAGGEVGAAIGVGDRLADRLVAARQQHDLERRPAAGRVASERAKTVSPSRPVKRGEGDVGVHHPHAGQALAALVVVVVIVVVVRGRRLGGVPHHDEIGAGLPVLDRLADREGGGDRLVQDVAHLHGAAPDAACRSRRSATGAATTNSVIGSVPGKLSRRSGRWRTGRGRARSRDRPRCRAWRR